MPHSAASRAVRRIKSSHVPCIIPVHYLYVPHVASALARKALKQTYDRTIGFPSLVNRCGYLWRCVLVEQMAADKTEPSEALITSYLLPRM